jgi:CheY-like chemotaxis protein
MATLSHELRSPLAAMLGWCAIARTGNLSAEVNRAIDTIERNARVQTRLVDDLLDATRMQANSLHLELVPVALDVPVLAAIDGVRPAAEAKQLSIRYDCVEPVPVVIADASRLQQIASNLLVNAVKFTPHGKTVTVSLRAVGDHAELRIADEGIGIDPAFMPHLFQRFRQADSGNARRHGGVGLGLSIVSSLVTLHHGEIHASSDGAGSGATFVVRLPMANRLAGSASVDAPSRTPAVDPKTSLLGIRVIVVDDEVDVRGAVAGLLTRAGATVLALESGAAVVQAMVDSRPDVLILDIGMPGEDGYTLMQRIRRLPSGEGGNVPAVSLTAHARDEDRRHALAMGFQAHLPKPVDVAFLLMTVRRLAGEPRTVQEESAPASREIPSSVDA